jgi:hypothetical protein
MWKFHDVWKKQFEKKDNLYIDFSILNHDKDTTAQCFKNKWVLGQHSDIPKSGQFLYSPVLASSFSKFHSKFAISSREVQAISYD